MSGQYGGQPYGEKIVSMKPQVPETMQFVHTGTYTSTLPHTIPRLQQDEEVENQHTPWLVPALSMVHLLAFILVMSHNNCERDINGDQDCVVSFLKRFSFESLMENPLLGPSATSLLDLGALESEMVTKAGEAWRLVTSMWLYAGLFHLVVNFTGLFLIGLRLERRFGFLKVCHFSFLIQTPAVSGLVCHYEHR